MRLEKDNDPKPDSPCPEVHPFAVFAPYAIMKPPTNAEEADIMVPIGAGAVVIVDERATLPSIAPTAKNRDFGGIGGPTTVLTPKSCHAYRPA